MKDMIRRKAMKLAAAVTAAATLPSGVIRGANAATNIPKWRVAGSYMESCNCAAACPCVFTSDPTHGDCTVLVGWHIDQGHFGNTNLDGLNVALAVYSPGNMIKTPWSVALYLDERGNKAQKDAMTAIFAGKAGGHMSVLAQFIGKVLGVKTAKIDFTKNGASRGLRIDGFGELEIDALKGQGGGPVTVSGNPVAIVPAQPAVVATSRSLKYADNGLSWDLSGRNGFFSKFTYQA